MQPASNKVKGAQKTGQAAKVHPNLSEGHENGKATKFSDQLQAKEVLDLLRGEKPVQEIAAKHPLHPNQVSRCKRQTIDGGAVVFSSGGKPVGSAEAAVQCPVTYWSIGSPIVLR